MRTSSTPVNDPAQHLREVRVSQFLLAWSVAAGLVAVVQVGTMGWTAAQASDLATVLTQVVFLLCLAVMLAGAWAYLLPRLAYYRRCQHAAAEQAMVHVEAPITERLTILVPAYKEERQVVWQTLMSAALQGVPGRRVVLLIDDPQQPTNVVDRQALDAMRGLPLAMQSAFDQVLDRLHALRNAAGPEHARLAQAHDCAARWLDDMQREAGDADHTARWLTQAILKPLAKVHRLAAQRLARQTADADCGEGWSTLLAEFEVTFSAFERKAYANLSHEPNKAMNLNAYLALMGGHYHTLRGALGSTLVPCGAGAPDAIHIPDAEFVLTLDADSLLLPGYAQRLLQVMRQPGNERMAVIQTPYSAVPGAASMCERIAGAQTDIQYLMHQGYTAHGATFWVGANALLRKAAIEDIATLHVEQGLWVKKYIHDRTVIEDTESSIDLVDKGWSLYNHNERLAYSATPPDFGALLIQRRRWADGGLIILPKAVRYLLRGPVNVATCTEAFLRVHYLSSVATVNAAFLLMMFGPFAQNLKVFWIPLAMAAYMVAYARDLRHCGYGWLDFPRVYALNLLLLPVNISGTLRSLYQAVTGRRAAFARTPKVEGRTAMPGGYVAVELLLLAITSALALTDAWLGHWLGAGMQAAYAALWAYGITVFIGWRAAGEDLKLWWQDRRSAAPLPAAAPNTAAGPEPAHGQALPPSSLMPAEDAD